MLSLYVAPFCVYPPLKKYLGVSNPVNIRAVSIRAVSIALIIQNLKSSCPGPILEVYEIDCIRYIAPLGEPIIIPYTCIAGMGTEHFFVVKTLSTNIPTNEAIIDHLYHN